MNSKTIACRLSIGEWQAFKAVCERHNLKVQDLLHSIIIDALVDEGYDALRCQQSPGRESSAAASEASRPAATGNNYWDYVSRPRTEVDL